MINAPLGSGLRKGVEHALQVINADDQTCWRNEGEGRTSTTSANVEDGSTIRKGFPGSLVRRGVGDVSFDGEHRDGMNPRSLVGLIEDVLGNRPRLEIGCPLISTCRQVCRIRRHRKDASRTIRST